MPLRHKVRLRASLAFITLAFFTLVDEAVKEGYVFNLADLISPALTHEKIFVISLIIGLLLGIKK